MSRVAKAPIPVVKGVEVKINGQDVNVKGSKGSMSMRVHDSVLVEQDGSELKVKPVTESAGGWAMAGTMRALLGNMVNGAGLAMTAPGFIRLPRLFESETHSSQ